MSLVYVYARWSSLEQTKGSTLARQIKNCSDYAEKRGWPLAGPPIIDRGRSAYTGENIQAGKLGDFARDVAAGRIKSPTLIVEELDRLSRQPADVMLTWLSPLIRAGTTIIVTQTNQVIDRSMLDTNMGAVMNLLITAFGSFTESRKKAERVSAAWEDKREAARRGEAVTRSHRHPKWLEVCDGEFVANPIRRLVVETIFELACQGYGKGLIAKNLNERAITNDTFSAWGVAHWTPTYIGRVIRNRAVLGEWQPHRSARADARRTKIGTPIENYYPPIIDAAAFAKANDLRNTAALKHQGRGIGLSNLLGRKARCERCGGQMSALGSARYRTNKNGSQTRHYFLYCQTAKIGKACQNNAGWPYDLVEKPLLDRLLTLALDDTHFTSEDQSLIGLEQALYRARDNLEKSTNRLVHILRLVPDPNEMSDQVVRDQFGIATREKNEAEERFKDAQAALETAKGAVSPIEHLRRVANVRAMMNDADRDVAFQARSRVKAALDGIVDSITFDDKSGRISVRLIGLVSFFWIERNGELSHQFDLSNDRSIAELPGDQRAIVRAYQTRRAAAS